ncbi:MAG: LCP family protein [Anaerolineaceae bacterium]|nr:LCP family protein [Anaerolineaceae bacterium]
MQELTQPIITRFKSANRRGKIGLALLMVTLATLFCIGLFTVLYLVFPPPHLDILILGMDDRSSGSFAGRTDAILLLGVDPARLEVNLLSLPRDLFIDVPGYGMQRINTINVLGEQEEKGSGPARLSASITQDFGIEVDRYVRLDFNGFVALIDAVGGITIDVERVIVDDAYPTTDGGTIQVRFESGVQHMDGERALIYARTRHADDDYRRASRQQQVLAALSLKLRDPRYWPEAWRILGEAVDTNLTIGDILAIAPPVILNAGRFNQLVIDRDYVLGTAAGYAVPNYEAIAPWLEGRFE